MTTPLSPAAQAIDDAAYQAWVTRDDPRSIAAAALRAAADQVVPEVDLHVSVANDLLPKDIGAAKWSARYEVRSKLFTLFTELENHR